MTHWLLYIQGIRIRCVSRPLGYALNKVLYDNFSAIRYVKAKKYVSAPAVVTILPFSYLSVINRPIQFSGYYII